MYSKHLIHKFQSKSNQLLSYRILQNQLLRYASTKSIINNKSTYLGQPPPGMLSITQLIDMIQSGQLKNITVGMYVTIIYCIAM